MLRQCLLSLPAQK
uniref:Uncharacterized protein n=1 Tax=Anguilla anguilla TaxID=7936 RepID=A0A0E9UJK7_ANGAN